MSQRAEQTRERILATAEQLVLKQGFASTAIDDIVQKAAITKSGFFYHFPDKTELAKALVHRYLRQDETVFLGLFERADELTEDPLQRLLLFLKLFAEVMANMEQAHPGCLVVTFTYENHLVEPDIDQLVKQGVLNWRSMIRERLEEVSAERTPGIATDLDALADMFTACVEGGIVLSRLFQSNQYLVSQVLLYRDHLRLLFDSPVRSS